MEFMRTNYYNSDIIMMHTDDLENVSRYANDPQVRDQAREMLQKFKMLYTRNDIPQELDNWSNHFFGISLSNERTKDLIASAVETSWNAWNDNIRGMFYMKRLSEACGYAYLKGNFELADELKKLNDTFPGNSTLRREDALKVISGAALSYLLTFMQTKNLEDDAKIIYFDGEEYIYVDTTVKPPQRRLVYTSQRKTY